MSPPPVLDNTGKTKPRAHRVMPPPPIIDNTGEKKPLHGCLLDGKNRNKRGYTGDHLLDERRREGVGGARARRGRGKPHDRPLDPKKKKRETMGDYPVDEKKREGNVGGARGRGGGNGGRAGGVRGRRSRRHHRRHPPRRRRRGRVVLGWG